MGVGGGGVPVPPSAQSLQGTHLMLWLSNFDDESSARDIFAVCLSLMATVNIKKEERVAGKSIFKKHLLICSTTIAS